MTKEFKLNDTLIPIEDGYVLVDKEAKLEKGKNIIDNVKRLWIDENKMDSSFIKVAKERGNCFVIIATIGKKIGQLPVVEIPKDNVYKKAEEFQDILDKTGLDKTITYNQALGFISGYQARENKGIYTEEDLLRYIELRLKHWKELIKDNIKSGEYKNQENPFKWTEDAAHKLAIQSLQKKKVIKGVVLPMENGLGYCPKTECYNNGCKQPEHCLKVEGINIIKINLDNTITPKEVIYEL